MKWIALCDFPQQLVWMVDASQSVSFSELLACFHDAGFPVGRAPGADDIPHDLDSGGYDS